MSLSVTIVVYALRRSSDVMAITSVEVTTFQMNSAVLTVSICYSYSAAVIMYAIIICITCSRDVTLNFFTADSDNQFFKTAGGIMIDMM